MGWDAFACIDHEAIEDLPEAASLLERFKEALRRAQDKAGEHSGTCDGGLPSGALFNSNSREMLIRATGEEWCGDDDWNEYTPEQIRAFASKANWDFEVPDFYLGAYYSAQEFLRVCVECGIGVYISW